MYYVGNVDSMQTVEYPIQYPPRKNKKMERRLSDAIWSVVK